MDNVSLNVDDLRDIKGMKRTIKKWSDRDWHCEACVGTLRFKLLRA